MGSGQKRDKFRESFPSAKEQQKALEKQQREQQKMFEKQLAALSHVPQIAFPEIPALPPPPEPPPPPPPPAQDVRGNQNAAYEQQQAARRRTGIRSTLLAGETGGPSNPSGGGTLLG